MTESPEVVACLFDQHPILAATVWISAKIDQRHVEKLKAGVEQKINIDAKRSDEKYNIMLPNEPCQEILAFGVTGENLIFGSKTFKVSARIETSS